LRRRTAFLSLLGLLVAVLVFIALGWFPQGMLRGYVEQRVQQALGPGSRIGRMHVVPGRLSVDVLDLVIESPDYRLEVPRGRLVLTPGFVFRQDLAFRVVELFSPRLVIHPPGGPSRPRRPFDQPVRIERLLVSGGTIVYDAPPPGPDLVRIEGVGIEGSLGMGALDLAASGGRWEGRAQPIPLGPLKGRLRVSPLLDLTVERIEASTRASHFTARGALGRAGDIRPDLTFEGVLALDDVERFAGPRPQMEGKVQIAGRVGHDGQALTVEAEVQGARIRIQGWPIDRGDAHVAYAATEPARTTLKGTFALLGGKAEAQANLRSGAADLRVRFDGVDADRLRRQGVNLGVPFDGRLGGDLHAAGPLDGALRVDGTLRAAGRTSPDLAVQAKLDLQGAVRPRAQAVDVRFTLHLDGTRGAAGGAPALREAHLVAKGRAQGTFPPAISAGYTGDVVLATASGPTRVPVAGDVHVEGGAVTADAHARGLGGTLDASLDARGSVARRLDVRGTGLDLATLRPGASGVVDLTFRASGPFARLTGTGEVTADELVWDEVRVGDVSASVTAVGGSGQVRFQAPELGATGDGTVDTRGFRGTLQLAHTDLARLQPLLTPERALGGVISGTVDVALDWDRPQETVVRARVDELDVQSGDTHARARAPFTLTARGRDVTVEGLDIEGPGLGFQGSGRLGLRADAPLDLEGHLDLDLAQLPAHPGYRLAGRISGDVELRGTPAAPRATGLVRMAGVQYQRPGFPLITVSDGLVELQGDAAYIRELHADFPGGRVDLLGRVPLAAVLSDEQAQRLGIAAGGGFEVEASFDVDLAQWPVREGWTMQGHLQGDLEFVGTRTRPRAFGLIGLDGVTVDAPGSRLLAVSQGQIELGGDVARTAGIEATVADGTVRLAGAVPLAAVLAEPRAAAWALTPGQADVRLTWNAVQLRALLEALRGRPSAVTATLNGEARLFGRLSAREALQGQLTLAETHLRVQDVDIVAAPFMLRLDHGQVTTDGITLSGPGGTFVAHGGANLIAETVDASGQGQIELRTLSPLLEEALLTGTATVDLTLTGSLRNPQPRGSVRVQNATLRLRDIRQPLTAIVAGLVFENGSVRIVEGSAQLGGGQVHVSGGGRLEGLRLSDVRVQLSGTDMGLRYPVGGERSGLWKDFKARVDAELTLTGQPGDFLLAGTVGIERGLYDADIFLEEGFLPPTIPPAVPEPSRFLRTVGLNISVSTQNAILVRNNLAQLEAVGSLWLRGDMDDPAPFGRLEIRPGGKVFLQEREFTITSGNLIYGGTTTPDISVRAETLIKNVEVARGESVDLQVALLAQGSLDRPGVELSSTPPLSQQEIASLIATGQRSVVLASGANLVGQQAAALLAGRFTREVARGLLDLGFDTVDIQPELIALEGDPGARFTFGKDVAGRVRLVYSIGLNNPEAQYYQIDFRVGAQNLTTRAQRTDAGNWAYSAGQRLRFGGARRLQAAEIQPTELSAVQVEGDLREFDAAIRSRIHAKPGKDVTYWDLLDDADRIRDLLVEQGYLEAVVDARLDETVAAFSGNTGPRYRWRVEGMPDPPDLTNEFRQSLFEEEAAERGRERLLTELRRRGHLRAQVETTVVAEGGYRTIVFQANPGPVLREDVRFPGAQALSAKALVDAAGGPAILLTDPLQARERIRAAYRAKQYLETKVGDFEVVQDGGVVHITVPIEEGAPAVVADVRFSGATLPADELRTLAAIPTGEPYDPVAAGDAVRRLRERYLGLGYAAVRITPTVATSGKDLALDFRVTEGARAVVGPVVIKGLRRTRESLVRGQIDLQPGEPLDPRRLAELERRLRDLGVFSRAVVTASEGTPATITIDLEEDARYGLAYDLRYEQGGTGASALVDGELRNLFGRGVVLSSRIRAGREIREGRLAFHVPSIFLPALGRAGDLTAAIFRRDERLTIAREIVPGEIPPQTFQDVRFEQGFNLHQTVHFAHPWEVLYGYGFRRANYSSVRFRPVETYDLGSIDASTVLDTRDNPLNPRRGNFYSLSVEGGHSALGSDYDYLKAYAQVSLTSYLTRTIIWAQGYRLGAMRAAGGARLPDEVLFRAGGPNSLRGFSAESLAAGDAVNDLALGESVIIINQELRYMPLQGRLGGAVFYDTGNVFGRLEDVDLHFTHTLGVGLRYDSVIGLIRADLAFPLNKPPGERSYRLLFGLGQAF
jgi:outer membrane protein assembly factor BamA/autotransporter translocation and assembly factor TamB